MREIEWRLPPSKSVLRFSRYQEGEATEVKNLVNSSTHVGSHGRVRESSSSRSGQDCAYFCHVMGFDNLTKFCPRSSPHQSSLYLHPHIHQPACRLAVCVCPVFAHPAHLVGNRTMTIGPRLRLVTRAWGHIPSLPRRAPARRLAPGQPVRAVRAWIPGNRPRTGHRLT